MKTKYKLKWRTLEIEPVEILKETKFYVSFAENSQFSGEHIIRESKTSDYYRYFDTHFEAKVFALLKINKRIEEKRKELDYYLETQKRLESEGV